MANERSLRQSHKGNRIRNSIGAQIDREHAGLSEEEKQKIFEERLEKELAERGINPELKNGFGTFYGIAPTGQAAKVLSEKSGLVSTTIHKALNNLERYGTFAKEEAESRGTAGIDPTLERTKWSLDNVKDRSVSLVVMDEASMVDNRLMANVLDGVKNANARLVATGDTKQLTPVGSGKPFELMQKHGVEISYITEVRRQKDEFNRDVVNTIKEDAVKAFEMLKEANKVTFVKDDDRAVEKQQALKTAVEKFKEWYEKGEKDTVVIVGTNEDRKKINDRVREYLKEKGIIDSNESIWLRAVVKEDTLRMKVPELRMDKDGNIKVEQVLVEKGSIQKDTLEFAKGDRIIFLKNDNLLSPDKTERFPVQNGVTAYITDVDQKHGALTVQFADGKSFTFSTDSYKAINHAYAITGHKSQGDAFKHVISVLDARDPTLSRNSFYVHATRPGNGTQESKETYEVIAVGDEEKIKEKISAWKSNESYIEAKERNEQFEREREEKWQSVHREETGELVRTRETEEKEERMQTKEETLEKLNELANNMEENKEESKEVENTKEENIERPVNTQDEGMRQEIEQLESAITADAEMAHSQQEEISLAIE